MEAPRFLTAEEVADRFRTTPEALHMQRRRGQQPGTLGLKIGKRILFDPRDIDAYLDSQRRAATSA